MENQTFDQPKDAEELFSSEYIDQELVNEFSSKIEERIDYYKEENAKYEMIFNSCKLWTSELCSTLDSDTDKVLDELCNIQETFGTVDLCASALSLSYIDNLKEDNNYLARLKSSTKLYMEINEKLSKEIDIISSELEESKERMDKDFNISNEEIYVLEKKVASYESELEKFEKKHPRLKNPDLDLTYISKETQVLADLQQEKEVLEKDLSVYRGLKPDLQEASRQLSETKKLHEQLKNKLNSGV